MSEHELPAGPFAVWLGDVLAAQSSPVGIDVPCGECTACCRSSFFIHVEPDETETLRRIPSELQFPAPGMAAGTIVLGYDERGQCPMFADGGCSIYEHRPRTCRRFDCRVYPATGLEPEDEPLVAAQARRWQFDTSNAIDERKQSAVRAAAVVVRGQAASRPRADQPRPSALALAVLRAHRAFLGRDESGEEHLVEPDLEAVRAALHD